MLKYLEEFGFFLLSLLLIALLFASWAWPCDLFAWIALHPSPFARLIGSIGSFLCALGMIASVGLFGYFCFALYAERRHGMRYQTYRMMEIFLFFNSISIFLYFLVAPAAGRVDSWLHKAI